MVPRHSIESILCLLQAVREKIIGVQFGITFINQGNDFHKVAFKRASTRPARWGQTLHANGAAYCHMACAESKSWCDNSDEEGLVWVVLWEDYFILKLNGERTTFLSYSLKVFL